MLTQIDGLINCVHAYAASLVMCLSSHQAKIGHCQHQQDSIDLQSYSDRAEVGYPPMKHGTKLRPARQALCQDLTTGLASASHMQLHALRTFGHVHVL